MWLVNPELHGHHYAGGIGLCALSIIIAVGIGTCCEVVAAVTHLYYRCKRSAVGKRKLHKEVCQRALLIVEAHQGISHLGFAVGLLYGQRSAF